MENTVLKKIRLNKDSPVEVEFTEGGVKLKFAKDTITLGYIHNSDCCENVYADFEAIKYYIPQLDSYYSALTIKGVEDMGILLCFEGRYYDEKVLVPCYNEQNGYYSDNLTLEINHNETIEKIDIRSFEQDKIY